MRSWFPILVAALLVSGHPAAGQESPLFGEPPNEAEVDLEGTFADRLRTAEEIRIAGDCTGYTEALIGTDRWLSLHPQMEDVRPATRARWRQQLGEAVARPCPAHAGMPSSPVISAAIWLRQQPGYVQALQTQQAVQQAQIDCNATRFDSARDRLIGQLEAVLRTVPGNRFDVQSLLRRQIEDARRLQRPVCNLFDDVAQANNGPTEEEPPPPATSGIVEQPSVYGGRPSGRQAAWMRLESARRECMTDAFEAARRDLIDAIETELYAEPNPMRAAELRRERERAQDMRLNRCDRERPPGWPGEHPPGDMDGHERDGDIGMPPPVPPMGHPPGMPTGPMFPDHDPPVM